MDIDSNQVPYLFSKAVQNISNIGSIELSKIYNLVYQTFYYNYNNKSFDKDLFIRRLFKITGNIENKLTNGLIPLTELGFNYLNINPILTKEDIDSNGNYTYKYNK